jgi:MYXO-CTERM domain-containing protein
MKTRAALGILAAAGLAATAQAQESVTYTLTWTEVLAGTTNAGNGNGSIDPGEGVRFAIRAQVTPGVGSPATYTPPPPPGTGTIAGLGSMFLDLLGTNLNGGTWSNIQRGVWALGGQGDPQASGNITSVQAGQFVLPGGTANSTNPIANIWRGVWNPSSYATRIASLVTAGAVASGGNHSSILIKYGVDPQGNDQYVAKFVAGVAGSSGSIPITPAPSSLALLGLGALVAGRRRR